MTRKSGHHGESERHSLQARGQKTGIGTQLKQLQNKQKQLQNKQESLDKQKAQAIKNYIIKNVPWITPDMIHVDLYHFGDFNITIYKPSFETLFLVNIPNKDFPDKEEIYYNTMEDNIRDSVHERTGDAVDEFLHKKIGNKLYYEYFVADNKDMYDYIEEKYPKDWKRIKKQVDKDTTQQLLDDPSDHAIEEYHEQLHHSFQEYSKFKELKVYSDNTEWDDHKDYKSVLITRIETPVNKDNISKIVKELKTIKPLL